MQRTYQLAEIAPTRAEGTIVAILSAVGRRQKFAAGAAVQHQGDAGNGFWLIETGRVMACRFSREGERTVYAVLGPGDLFGELACFADVPRQVDAVAESDAVLVWIDSVQIDRLLQGEPLIARWLLNSLANQLRIALDRIESNRGETAQSRMARILVDLAVREGPEIVTTQQQLADFVGVSRVTAGQILAGFAAEGLIQRGYGRIVVIDADALDRCGG